MAGREGNGFFQLSGTATAKDTTASTRLSVPTAEETINFEYRFTTGTGDLNFDRIYSKVGTLSASGTLDLDFAGSLSDSLGQTITMVEIAAIIVKNRATAVGVTLQVGGTGGGAGLATLFGNTADFINVPASASIALVCPLDGGGYAVTATTADTLRFTNASGSTALDYEILICGRSA